MKESINVCITLTPGNKAKLKWLANYYEMSVSGYLAMTINHEYTQTKLMKEHLEERKENEK